MSDFRDLYGKIGYIFKDEKLLVRALTHSSVSVDNYERLEFLGDSIVNFAVSKILFDDPSSSPGDLTKKRQRMVSKEPLAFLANELGFVALCKKSCALSEKKESDLYESVTAAIALDGGLDEAIAFVRRTILLAPVASADSISAIKELCEKNKWTYQASVVEVGTEKYKKFSAEVYVNGKSCGSATAGTKKDAEKAACTLALEKL